MNNFDNQDEILKAIHVNKIEDLFDDDMKCLEYLAYLKWNNGFKCRKCEHTNYCKGKIPYSRRCTRCKNEESATAQTIFHHSKFPISKAFNIVYQVFKNGNAISSHDLARQLSLRQMTCWKFKDKVMKKIELKSRLSESVSFQEILLDRI
jgi:hypothetical protein